MIYAASIIPITCGALLCLLMLADRADPPECKVPPHAAAYAKRCG